MTSLLTSDPLVESVCSPPPVRLRYRLMDCAAAESLHQVVSSFMHTRPVAEFKNMDDLSIFDTPLPITTTETLNNHVNPISISHLSIQPIVSPLKITINNELKSPNHMDKYSNQVLTPRRVTIPQTQPNPTTPLEPVNEPNPLTINTPPSKTSSSRGVLTLPADSFRRRYLTTALTKTLPSSPQPSNVVWRDTLYYC